MLEGGDDPPDPKHRVWESELAAKIKAALAAKGDDALSAERRAMAESPGEHLEILRLWSKVPCSRAHPFQRLFSRARARQEIEDHLGRLVADGDMAARLRTRGSFNASRSAVQRMLPSVPSRRLSDDVFLWLRSDRLGLPQPCIA